MSLQLRFAFLFSFFVLIFLIISFTSVYFLCEDFRKDDFRLRLKANAQNEYNFITAGNPSPGSLSTTAPTLIKQHIVIFDSSFKPTYKNPGSASIGMGIEIFEIAKDKGEAFVKKELFEGVVLARKYNNQLLYIAVLAYDFYGIRKMQNLKNILIITLSLGFILSGLFAFFFARQVLRPLNNLNKQIRGITENNLDARVVVNSNDVELNRIARSFNDMLNRLQKSFTMQKNFVQHASHELRTPLANMLSQTEAALNKELPADELREVLKSLKEDQVNLTKLTNSLLLLSQYESFNTNSKLSPVRVDEVLYESIDTIKEEYPDAQINLDFSTVPENSTDLIIQGVETLIRTAFQNLIKNAYIYSSNQQVTITIDANTKDLKIIFENKGQQLTEIEKESLFVPFYRGENSVRIKGTGIGLSIVDRILKLHNGRITYEALKENLNRFTLLIQK